MLPKEGALAIFRSPFANFAVQALSFSCFRVSLVKESSSALGNLGRPWAFGYQPTTISQQLVHVSSFH